MINMSGLKRTREEKIARTVNRPQEKSQATTSMLYSLLKKRRQNIHDVLT